MKKVSCDKNAVLHCGNCWGYQQYEGKVFDKTIDARRRNKDGFIINFIKKYFTNINS